MSDESDEQIVVRWRAHGDSSAIAALADRYLGRFFRTARAMLLTTSDAEDVAQETMLKIVRAIDSFDTTKCFRTWSYTVLLNTIRSERRRQKIHTQRLKEIDKTEVGAETPEKTPAGHDDVNLCVTSAIQKLTEKQRTALVMMVMEGRSAAEVAEMEGCSIDAIYQRVAEAKKSLRREPSLQKLWIDS